MKKRKILIPCGVLLAAVPLFLIEVRNSCQKSYVGDVRTAAKVLANLTDTLLTDIGAGMTEGTYDAYCSFHAENPLKNGFYRAEYDPKTQTLTYLTNDGVSAVTVEMMDNLWKKKLYFMAEIRDGQAARVSACRSDILTEGNLTEPDYSAVRDAGPPPELTLAGYWLDKYIGYYPPGTG